MARRGLGSRTQEPLLKTQTGDASGFSSSLRWVIDCRQQQSLRLICVESESSLDRRSAEAPQPQSQPIIAGPPLQPRAHYLHTPCCVSLHFPSTHDPPPLPARTEPRGRWWGGSLPGSVSRARRQLAGGECATCERPGRAGGGLRPFLGPAGPGRADGEFGRACIGWRLTAGPSGLGLAGVGEGGRQRAGGWARRPRFGLREWRRTQTLVGWVLQSRGERWRRQQSCPVGLGWGPGGIYPGWARDSPADFSGRAPSPALGEPTHARAQSAGTRSAAPAAGALQPWASPGERPRGARRSGRRPVPAPAPPAFSPGTQTGKGRGPRGGFFFFLSSRSRGSKGPF